VVQAFRIFAILAITHHAVGTNVYKNARRAVPLGGAMGEITNVDVRLALARALVD